MASTFSFDITSTIDFQEVDNALNQAAKRIFQNDPRYRLHRQYPHLFNESVDWASSRRSNRD